MLPSRTKLQRGILISLALLVFILVLQRISSPGCSDFICLPLLEVQPNIYITAASNHAVEDSQQKLLFGVAIHFLLMPFTHALAGSGVLSVGDCPPESSTLQAASELDDC